MENRSTPESACPGRKVDAVWKIPFHDHHEQYSLFGKFHQVPQREEYGLFARSDSS